MSAPKVVRGAVSYQHRAYRAEQVAEATLDHAGKLLGWETFFDLVHFHPSMHEVFARVSGGRELPMLSKGTGAASSRYYSDEHRLKVLNRDLNVLAYTHELAHAATSTGRGNGHNPQWAGAYMRLLMHIDPMASHVLREAFAAEHLTIK